jgi:predicted GNAT family acetyltransferase
VSIDASNARLLQTQMPDWLPDVGHRSPFLAAIENDQAVAVCASVRISAAAHEAGIETHSEYRQRGHAARVVAAWAEAVLAMGATPYYSTSWENSASQAVARRLEFELVGVDYHVR